jgi:uracil-DNA glycosylase family protein
MPKGLPSLLQIADVARAVEAMEEARKRIRSALSGKSAKKKRRLADSNRRTRLCRPLPNHSAKAPAGEHRIRRSGHNLLVAAAAYLPEQRSLPHLREAVRSCRGCDLYKNATQAVFGEGAARAELMLVGEQPGDKEDLAGRPFVGPAGQLLDRALEEAGIDRAQTYVTNAVKHFKWQARGKRRIHQKPTWSEQMACRPWLEAELAAVKPRVLVCLGATAAQSLLGRDFRVTRHRGELLDSQLAEHVTATIHPSAILRQQDEESRQAELAAFVDDLRVVAALI